MLRNRREFGFWNPEAPQIPLSLWTFEVFRVRIGSIQAELRGRVQGQLKEGHLSTTITRSRTILENNGCL